MFNFCFEYHILCITNYLLYSCMFRCFFQRGHLVVSTLCFHSCGFFIHAKVLLIECLSLIKMLAHNFCLININNLIFWKPHEPQPLSYWIICKDIQIYNIHTYIPLSPYIYSNYVMYNVHRKTPVSRRKTHVTHVFLCFFLPSSRRQVEALMDLGGEPGGWWGLLNSKSFL